MDNHSLQILLVDDNSTHLLLLEEDRTLRFALTQATRLDEALQCMARVRFDAVLLDLILPDSQGLETFVRMHREHPEIPILIVSHLDDEFLAAQAVQAGAQDYLVKSVINGAMLARTIHYAIERKRCQQRLVASEIGYRRLFEAAQDGVFILDAETGQITDANPSIEMLLGHTADEFVGRRLWEIGPFRDSTASQAAFATLLQKGFIRYDDIALATKTGHFIDVEFVSNAYMVEGRQVIQCNIRDITERKRIEQALQRSEQEQRQLAQELEAERGRLVAAQRVAKVGSWETDLATMKAVWSDETHRIFETDPAIFDPTHQAFLELIPLDDHARVDAAFVASLGQRTACQVEHRICLPDSRVKFIEERWQVYFDEQEKPVRAVGTCQDVTERRIATEELEARTHEIVTTWESMTDAFFSLDTEWCFTRVNSQAAQLWDKSAEGMIGKNIWEEFPEGVTSKFYQEYSRAANEQVVVDFEAFYPPHTAWYEVHVYPSAKGLSVYFRDITGRKQAEEAIRRGELRFRSLIEATTAIVWHTPASGEFELEQPEWSAFTGQTWEELKGWGWLNAIHPEDQGETARVWSAAVATCTSYRVEHRLRHHDGEYRYMIVRGVPLLGEDGAIQEWIGIHTDITERKNADELVRSSEANLAIAQRMSHLGSWELELTPHQDWRQNRLHWSDEVFRIFGYAPRAVEASFDLFKQSLHPEDYLHVEAITEQALRDGNGYSLDHRILLPDGTERIVHEQVDFLFDAAGKPQRLVGTVQDITDRKLAEAALRASEERFQSIVANVPGMVYQFSKQPDGSIAWPFVGEGFREIFEMEPDSLEGDPYQLLEKFHPEDKSEFSQGVLASEQSLRPFEWEGRLRMDSGKVKWVQIISRPKRLSDGSTLWNGLFMDISARKEAEEELDRFFTISLDMLAIIGSDGYIKRLNPAFEATLGFSNAELMAVPFLEFVHPEDHAATLAEMAKLEGGIKVLLFENRYRCRDGQWKWLRWMCAPFEELWYCVAHDVTNSRLSAAALQKANDELELNVFERTAELSLTNKDLRTQIAERQLAEFEVKRSGEELQTFIDAMGTLAAKVALDGTILIVNKIAFDASELSREEYMATNFLEGPWWTFDSEVHARVCEVFRQALLGTPINYDESIFVFGKVMTVNFSLIPMRNANGEVEYLIAEARDITEIKKTEQALHQAKDEAERANLAKSVFLSRMSHELRTPLNAILGFGQILQREELTLLQKESTQHILKGGRHLLDLINEVLDIARVDAGGTELSIEPIALDDVVPESCALMRGLASERDIRLEEDTVAMTGICVLADRQHLKQVLINLLANGIKYNRPGGKVDVSCYSADGLIRITVRDSGPGISAEDLTKLFTPFERLGAANTDVEGTGLGLVLSQRLVAAMGGALTVESVLGEGSTFVIEFPQAAAPVGPLANSPLLSNEVDATRIEGRAERQYTVLCIEDNISNLRLLEAILRDRPDVRLLAAMQGGMGLDLAGQHQPDLILLDLHLPDISGQEVLRRLRQSALTRDIPVVVVSADATPPQIERLLEDGARAYLTKPLDIPEFLRVFNEELSARLGPKI